MNQLPDGVVSKYSSLSDKYVASYGVHSHGDRPAYIFAEPAESELEAALNLSSELEIIGERLLAKSEECRAYAQALDAKEQQTKATPTPEIEEKQVLTRWLNDLVSVVYSDGLFTAWYETGTQPWGEISLCGKPSEDAAIALENLRNEWLAINLRSPHAYSTEELRIFTKLVKASKSTEAQE